MKFAIRPTEVARRSFVADAALNAAANIFLAGLAVASGILAARLLGPNGRGELAAIQTWPGFIGSLAMLGMPEALVYYSARQPSEAGCYLGSALIVALASALPFTVVGYLLMPLMLHAQASAIVRAGRWYLLVVPIFALIGLPRQSLQGRSDFVPWNAMRIAPNMLWIAVLLLAWASARAVPAFVASANLAALALLIFPLAVLAARRIPGPFRPDPKKWGSMLSYGLPCMITLVPQTLNSRLDQMLMAAFMAPHDLGLYAVAVAWSGAACPLLGALAAVTAPAVASAGDQEKGAQRFTTGVRAGAALALLLAVAAAAITPVAIPTLFGATFKGAIPAALVLVPAGAVGGFNAVLHEGLLGLGRPHAVLQAELAGLGVTALALAILLSPIGIMGAALASLLGYSTVTAVLLRKARRYTDTSARSLLFLTRDELQLALATLLARAQSAVVSVE